MRAMLGVVTSLVLSLAAADSASALTYVEKQGRTVSAAFSEKQCRPDTQLVPAPKGSFDLTWSQPDPGRVLTNPDGTRASVQSAGKTRNAIGQPAIKWTAAPLDCNLAPGGAWHTPALNFHIDYFRAIAVTMTPGTARALARRILQRRFRFYKDANRGRIRCRRLSTTTGRCATGFAFGDGEYSVTGTFRLTASKDRRQLFYNYRLRGTLTNGYCRGLGRPRRSCTKDLTRSGGRRQLPASLLP